MKRLDWNERDFVRNNEVRQHQCDFPEQWERYRFAARWLEPDQLVLDIACGSGYGTALLAKTAGRRAHGLDISGEAVAWANANFSEWADFDLSTPQLISELRARFDVVVSIETLEHMDESAGRAFLSNLHSMLRPGGRIVLTTPLNESPARFSPDNPFHIREYNWAELGELIEECFVIEHRFTQISRLGRFRECLGSLVSNPRVAVEGQIPQVDGHLQAMSLKDRWVDRMRRSPFWRRGRFVERSCRFGGVQVIVSRSKY